MSHTSSQTFFRELDKKGAQASRLFLQDGKATGDAKDTGKMPVLHYKITSTGKLIDDALEAVEKENTRNGDLRIASSPSSRPATKMSPLPDTFTRDQHPDLRADFVMALPSAAARSPPRSHFADRPNGRINPPFNIKEWWDGKLEGDARWNRSEAELASHAQFYKNRGEYGTLPQGNANFAWVQHMLHHLAPNGSMALLLANGSMSSNSSGEGDIRRALIKADLVECMVAPHGHLPQRTKSVTGYSTRLHLSN